MSARAEAPAWPEENVPLTRWPDDLPLPDQSLLDRTTAPGERGSPSPSHQAPPFPLTSELLEDPPPREAAGARPPSTRPDWLAAAPVQPLPPRSFWRVVGEAAALLRPQSVAATLIILLLVLVFTLRQPIATFFYEEYVVNLLD